MFRGLPWCPSGTLTLCAAPVFRGQDFDTNIACIVFRMQGFQTLRCVPEARLSLTRVDTKCAVFRWQDFDSSRCVAVFRGQLHTSWPRLKTRSGLKNKITDQNIYPKSPLQFFQKFSNISGKYLTLKIPYKNSKIFLLKIFLPRMDFSPQVRRFLTEAMTLRCVPGAGLRHDAQCSGRRAGGCSRGAGG